AALAESVIVNCTGLGSMTLFDDRELVPVKGQLVVLVPQPEVTYTAGAMMPRGDGIVLGREPTRCVVARRGRGRAGPRPQSSHRVLRLDAATDRRVMRRSIRSARARHRQNTSINGFSTSRRNVCRNTAPTAPSTARWSQLM